MLNPLRRDGVLVAQDEVDLVGRAALVGAEHHDVRRVGVQVLQVEAGGGSGELQVCATAFETLLKAHLVLQHEIVVGADSEVLWERE